MENEDSKMTQEQICEIYGISPLSNIYRILSEWAEIDKRISESRWYYFQNGSFGRTKVFLEDIQPIDPEDIKPDFTIG